MTVSEFELKMALNTIAWAKEEHKKCRWVEGDSGFNNLSRGGRLIAVMGEENKAYATIKRSQMERAWPMLAHLNIHRWQ